jgi:hydroxyethylthiazole kinase-like uncharacterized protein yjeF
MVDPPRLDGAAVRDRWPLPDPQESSDKTDRGQILVIGGATQTPGAVGLAGIAALRVGAGRLTIATTESTAVALAVAVPESGVVGLPCTPDGGIGRSAVATAAELLDGCDAVLVGPGMTNPQATKEFVGDLARHLGPDPVMVLDALAASCGVVEEGLGDLAKRTVITPNEAEARHLLGDADGSESERAVRIATGHGVTTALGSSLAAPDGSCWRIPRGNPGLGTSGSGDVLSGAVAGIAARTHDPLASAAWGLLLHGAAGDRLAASVGTVGFLARELLDELPACLRQLSA